MIRMDSLIKDIKRDITGFIRDESGVGVIEVVLILVVLIGLVIDFKDSINSLLPDIFNDIHSLSEDVY